MGCCQAKCCARFPYPLTPVELRERWEKWDWNQPHTKENAMRRRDDLFIADMLRPLSAEEAADRTDEFDLRQLCDYESYPVLYACHHWDEATKLCKAYSERPRMCAEFPYGRECEHGCGYTGPPSAHVRAAGFAVQEYKPPPMLEAGA